MGLAAMISFFWMFSFKPVFSLSSFTFINRLFSFSSLSATKAFYVAIKCYMWVYFNIIHFLTFNPQLIEHNYAALMLQKILEFT